MNSQYSGQRRNQNLENKFFQFMKRAINQGKGNERPQRRYNQEKPQYKKQKFVPQYNQRRFNPYPQRNNNNTPRVNVLYDEIETLKKENNYLRNRRQTNRNYQNGNGYGPRQPVPFRSSPYW